MARGLVAGHQALNITGVNRDVDNSPEFLVPGGVYNFLTVASTMRIAAGGDSDDTVAGVGARTVIIGGLDADFNQIQEVIPCNGTSASISTTQEFIRVLGVAVIQAGAYGGSNVGDMTIETTGGTFQVLVQAGVGLAQLGLVTIPAGKTGYLQQITFFAPSSTTVIAEINLRVQADIIVAPFGPTRTILQVDISDPGGSIEIDEVPGILSEKSDIWLTVTSDISNNKTITAIMDILLIDN